MKKLVALKLMGLLAVGAAALSAGGCANYGPYTETERMHLYARAMQFDYVQLRDDVDEALLLRPGSYMSVWNVRPR